jgi:hypothetical protein
MGIGDAGNQGRRDQRANARDGLKSPAQRIGAVPGKDAPVSLQDLPLGQHELGPQRVKAFPRHRRHVLVGPLVDEPQQPLHAVAADAGHNAKLSHVSPDRIDPGRTLAHEQLPGPMQHQHRLLLLRLYCNKAHGRSRHCLADRLRIRRIVLVPLDLRLHISGRHQPDVVPKLRNLTRPVMRGGASLQAYNTRSLLLEERQNLTTS